MSTGPQEHAPLVSVAILSFNSRELLPRAVESVQQQLYAPIELIIVDNGSTDGTAELLAQWAHAATVIRLGENTGFARGMNAGYAASHGELFIPLNTDAVLSPSFVGEAVAVFARHADVGIVAPEVFKIAPDGPWRFWQQPHALRSEGGLVRLTRALRVDVPDAQPLDWRPSFKANGACPVIRRAVIEQLRATFGAGPFDPVFDTYGEDVDFAFKAWSLRWRTMFARQVVAGHVRSYASALELPDKRGRLRINLLAERYINAVRHLPRWSLVRVLARALAADLRMVLRQRIRGDAEAATDLRAAWSRVWRMRWALLRFRWQHRTWTRIDFPREVYCEVPPVPGPARSHDRQPIQRSASNS